MSSANANFNPALPAFLSMKGLSFTTMSREDATAHVRTTTGCCGSPMSYPRVVGASGAG